MRAIRDLAIAILGVLLAIATREGGGAERTAWIILGTCFVIGAIGAILSRVWLPSGKNRKLRSTRVKAGLWALEAEVALLHTSVAILLFTGAFSLLGELTANLTENTEKYWFGAASGFILGGLTSAITAPGKDVHWIRTYVQKRLKKSFTKIFGRRESEGGPLLRKSIESRWEPDGMEAQALRLDSYENEKGERVSGWAWSARRDRCDTLIHGLAKAVIPEGAMQSGQPVE
jgi:hypothetical protein